MRKILMMAILCMGLFACGNNSAKNDSKVAKQEQKNVVEVLYFHGKQRCPTCKAIEEETKKLVEVKYTRQLKEGTLIFKSVDIAEDEMLANKYEVTWSSLIIVDYNNGKETVENMTGFAFANARSAPDTFREKVSEQIEKMLKD